MIQQFLKEELAALFPDLAWSYDYNTVPDNSATVYAEGGPAPSRYETDMQYPTYMIYFRSSSWDYIKTVAGQVADYYSNRQRFTAWENLYNRDGEVIGQNLYLVYQSLLGSEPQRIGVVDGIMEYSINLDLVLRQIEGE